MDVISSTAFGIETDSLSDPDAPILRHANAVMNINQKPSVVYRLKLFAVVVLFFLLPSKLFIALERFGVRLFDQAGFDYFTDLCEKILTSRVEESGPSRKDFVELCRSQLVPEPDPKAEDSVTDPSGYVWSQKGIEYTLHYYT